jgi:hypothetical protein
MVWGVPDRLAAARLGIEFLALKVEAVRRDRPI